jgi:hypothetical protein
LRGPFGVLVHVFSEGTVTPTLTVNVWTPTYVGASTLDDDLSVALGDVFGSNPGAIQNIMTNWGRLDL